MAEALVKRRASNVLGSGGAAPRKEAAKHCLRGAAKLANVARWRQHAAATARTNSAAGGSRGACAAGSTAGRTAPESGGGPDPRGRARIWGRAQSAGQPDVRRLSSAVSNVDGFTLVEGEATPLTFKGGRCCASRRFSKAKEAAGTQPSAGRPLDTIANLARTPRRIPATDADAAGAGGQRMRRTPTAGADFAVPPVRRLAKRTWGHSDSSAAPRASPKTILHPRGPLERQRRPRRASYPPPGRPLHAFYRF